MCTHAWLRDYSCSAIPLCNLRVGDAVLLPLFYPPVHQPAWPSGQMQSGHQSIKKKKECHNSMFYEIPLYPDSPETSQPRVIQAPTSYSKPSKSTSSQHLMGWLTSTASPHMFSICKVVHLLIKNMRAGFYFSDM